jgi:D-3-phosphoglycerate dehydrogenase
VFMQDALIIDSFHPLLLQKLDEAGISYTYTPELKPDEVLAELSKGYRGLILRSKMDVNRDLMQKCPHLRLVARGGAGMDNIDETAAAECGVTLLNAGEANSQSVAEQTVGMMLALLHNIVKSNAEVKNFGWQREANRGIELGGKTVGIIGFGNAGSAVARLLSGFNVRILAYDKFKKGYGNGLVEEVSMQEIFELADIVTLHIPLDSHSKFMVNSDYLQSFVRKIFLLNLSRGEVVRTENVVSALKNGQILGFAADVLEVEDPIQLQESGNNWFKELIAMPQVILTPHVGGWSKESYVKISEVLGDKIALKHALIKG